MSKIFIGYQERGKEMYSGFALAEDGRAIAGHLSSSPEWSEHDMGLCSDWKHDKYQEKYPDGYELVNVGEIEKGLAKNVEFATAYALNKQLAAVEDAKKEKE